MTVNELDDYMRDWFQRLSAKEQPLPSYSPAKVERSVAEFHGEDVEKVLKKIQTLGGTNCNTNENNRNV